MSSLNILKDRLADEQKEDFARCLFRDIVGCFSIAARLNLKFPPELEEERCVPDTFFQDMVDFSKPFISGLKANIACLPVLLYSSSDFFRRFAYSVCLELSKREDEQIAFLKVVAFLVVLTATAFVNGCYRSFDDIPDIFYRMLKHHLRTKFYTEKKFEEMVSKCQELQLDENWNSKALDDMRSVIEESCNVELAATKLNPQCFELGTYKLTVQDLKNQSEQSDFAGKACKYCGIQCIVLLKVFFQPKIMYKPECKQM